MGIALGLGLGIAHAGAPTAAPFDLTGWDTGNLVAGDLNSPEWVHHDWTSDGTTVEAVVDGASINEDSNAGGLGRLYCRFIAPTGCTEVTLTVRCKATTGTPAPYFCVYQPGVGPVGAYLNPTLDATMTDYAITRSVTAGQEYGVLLFFNAAGQCPVTIESVTCAPDAGSAGIFGGTFYRLSLTHARAAYNAEPDRYKDNSATMSNISQASPAARWEVLTDAEDFALLGGPNGSYATYSRLAAEVDGTPTVNLAAASFTMQTFSLSAGTKRVSPYVPALYTDGVDVFGSWPLALFVGECDALSLPTAAGAGTIILAYGDSITAGFNCDIGVSHWQLLRTANRCKPLVKAMGSDALFFDGGTAGDRTAWVGALASLTFDEIYLAIGTNDWGLALWANAAAFEAAYSDLLDKLVAAYPTTTIYAQTPIPRADMATNANLEAISLYRTAISNAAAGRGANVVTIDGTTLCVIGDLPDNVHPVDGTILRDSISAEIGV